MLCASHFTDQSHVYSLIFKFSEFKLAPYVFSETSTIHTGLLVEVWSKNIILDRAIGFQYIQLQTVPCSQYEYHTGNEQWYNIDTEQIIVNGEVQGTRDPTGHMILLDLHFELPFGEKRDLLSSTAFY